jgi:hypothetical protein
MTEATTHMVATPGLLRSSDVEQESCHRATAVTSAVSADPIFEPRPPSGVSVTSGGNGDLPLVGVR